MLYLAHLILGFLLGGFVAIEVLMPWPPATRPLPVAAPYHYAPRLIPGMAKGTERPAEWRL